MHVFCRIPEKGRARELADESMVANLASLSEDPWFIKWIEGYRIVGGESGRLKGALVHGWRLLQAKEVMLFAKQLREILQDDFSSVEMTGGICLFRTEWKSDIVFVSDGDWAGKVIHLDLSNFRGYELFPRFQDFFVWVCETYNFDFWRDAIDYRVGLSAEAYKEILRRQVGETFDYEDQVEKRKLNLGSVSF